MADEVKKQSKWKNFVKGIVKENPLFVMVLGTCPALATTTSLEAAIGMGLLFTIVLICSNVIISSLRKIIPDEIRTPAYIVVIATFVTIVKMMTNAFLPSLYATLGVFISLIVVNCIVLGRAEAYASKNTILDSLLDACGMGIGYTLSLICIAFFREVIGSGVITFGKIFTFLPVIQLPILKYVTVVDGSSKVIYDYSISILQQPTGAFIVFGLVMAFIGFIGNRKKERIDFEKRYGKDKITHVEDDKKVIMARIVLSLSAILVGLVAALMVFAPAINKVSPDGDFANVEILSWLDVYFSHADINGASASFVGYTVMLIGVICSVVAVFFNRKWNLKNIWLSIVSGLTLLLGGLMVFNTSNLYCLVNGIDEVTNYSLGSGPLVGGILAICACLLAFASVLAPAILDSIIVAKQKKIVTEVK